MSVGKGLFEGLGYGDDWGLPLPLDVSSPERSHSEAVAAPPDARDGRDA